ncbi:MAG: hypothetical protein LLG15_12935 [Betaproteobacteria bacterium]|nr:hypothetical protein [Betaproteobacteria bacterium]
MIETGTYQIALFYKGSKYVDNLILLVDYVLAEMTIILQQTKLANFIGTG